MTHDDTTERLRRALAARAESVRPDPDGLDRIEERLMRTPRFTEAQRWILGGVAVVAVLLLSAVALLGGDDGDADVTTGGDPDPTSTTTTTTATTVAPQETTTSTTTTFLPTIDPYTVAFPSPNTSRSFESPQAAARAYATDVLGFTELVLGPAEPVGEGQGVVVQAWEEGPETLVTLVQQADGAWFVTGSSTPDIEVLTPMWTASLASPFETTGNALAFEGTVEVLVLRQEDGQRLGEGFVTGSGSPPAGPFAGDISFLPPPEPTPGVLVFRTTSQEDGGTISATSLPVRLTNLTT